MALYQISVMLLTYNSNLEKIKRTLISVLAQKNIKIEIIIADDASKNNFFDKIIVFFKHCNFNNFKIIEHQSNMGTVSNCYDAVLAAEGEYIYGISPGDILYNENTLKNMYDFAKREKCKICFGNTISYMLHNNGIIVLTNVTNPRKPQFFDEKVPLEDQKYYFLLGNTITGPSFLREKNFAVYYFRKILGVAKFVEDNTSTAFALADGYRIYHYDSYVVWYEYGSGVSTSGKKKWQNLLKKDFDACFLKLKEEYPIDYVISKYTLVYKYNKMLQALLLMFLAPDLFIKALKFKLAKASIGYNKPFDRMFLENIINNGGIYASN